MIDRMITVVRRLVACLTLLLPFQATADGAQARRAAASAPDLGAQCPGDAPPPCPNRPTPPAPSLPQHGAIRDGFGLLLPKLPLMPSACRPLRQYRSFSHDKLQRQPCYYV